MDEYKQKDEDVDELRPFGNDHLSNGLYQALTQDPRLRDVPPLVKDQYIRSVKNGSKPPVVKVPVE